MKRISLLVISWFCLMGLAAREHNSYTTVTDVAYRSDLAGDSYADSLCRLDFYYPADSAGFATVIWLHGGSLTGGHRSIPEGLKRKGFAVVGVDYRLTPRVKVEDCIADAAAAVAWTVGNVQQYGGDASKIFLAGHSAGGYLTYMIGLDKRWLAPHGLDPDSVLRAIIPYSGQVVTHFARRKELGLPADKPLVDDMAPMYHMRKDCVPIFITTADRDMELLGRYEENAYFWRMMQVIGHPRVSIKELQGFRHGNMTQPSHYLTVGYVRQVLKESEN